MFVTCGLPQTIHDSVAGRCWQ